MSVFPPFPSHDFIWAIQAAESLHRHSLSSCPMQSPAAWLPFVKYMDLFKLYSFFYNNHTVHVEVFQWFIPINLFLLAYALRIFTGMSVSSEPSKHPHYPWGRWGNKKNPQILQPLKQWLGTGVFLLGFDRNNVSIFQQQWSEPKKSQFSKFRCH